jgi:hypothetical protein
VSVAPAPSPASLGSAGAEASQVPARALLRLAGVVLAGDNRGVVIEAGGRSWLLPRAATGSLRLDPGMPVRLELWPAGTGGSQEARLVEIAGRRVDPPPPLARLDPPIAVERPDAVAKAAPAQAWQTLARALVGDAAPPGLRLPQPDADLAGRLLRLIGALMEERPAAPRVGLDGAPERALGELAQLAREPLPGGWRLLLLPFGGGEGTLLLRLWLQGEGAARDREGRRTRDEDDDPPQRAIFELDLARIGRLQLDALCRKGSFKLTVRSARPLEAALRREIGGIFVAACGAAGLAGELRFAPQGLLRLPDPPSGATPVLSA